MLHRTLCLLLVGGLGALPALAQDRKQPVDSLLTTTLTALNAGAEYPSLRWPRVTDVAEELHHSYAGREFSPLWSKGGVPTPAARAVLDALATVDTRGLDAEDYDVARLRSLARNGLGSTEIRADFDITLSVAALRVLHTLRNGRISASEAHARLQLPQDTMDFSAELLALSQSATPSKVLDAAEPPYLHYRLLKSALAVYRAEAAADTSVLPHVRQIILTLERWRWLPHHFVTTPIFVNIPAFRLYALGLNSDREADMLAMDVVVGDAFGHQTPVFSGELADIIFAPYWDVPSSIALAELVPIALRDPHLLTVNNYEIVDQRDRPLPATLTNVRRVAAGRARIRQLPGGSNALGRVKFVFPNDFNVYLHDTPVQAAFERERRDISHGCIRIADPGALARLLLRDQPAWDSAAVGTAMSGLDPQRVPLTHSVPVHIVYATAVAREDGRIFFYDDIYGLDQKLSAQLAAGYPYRR